MHKKVYGNDSSGEIEKFQEFLEQINEGEKERNNVREDNFRKSSSICNFREGIEFESRFYNAKEFQLCINCVHKHTCIQTYAHIHTHTHACIYRKDNNCRRGKFFWSLTNIVVSLMHKYKLCLSAVDT